MNADVVPDLILSTVFISIAPKQNSVVNAEQRMPFSSFCAAILPDLLNPDSSKFTISGMHNISYPSETVLESAVSMDCSASSIHLRLLRTGRVGPPSFKVLSDVAAPSFGVLLASAPLFNIAFD